MTNPFQTQPDPIDENDSDYIEDPIFPDELTGLPSELDEPVEENTTAVKTGAPDEATLYAFYDSQADHFTARLDGADALPDEALLDSAVLHYEFDRRRRNWWAKRRWFLYGFAALALLLFLTGLVSLILKVGSARFLIVSSLVSLVIFLLITLYCWWSLPRLLSFGRMYRRFIAYPLERGGLVWNDPAIPPPDFSALRDNYFSLYMDSDELGAKIQPDDEEETARKKRTLNELTRLIAPLKSTAAQPSHSSYIPAAYTTVLDKLWLQPVEQEQYGELAVNTLPEPPQPDQVDLFKQLAHAVEDYSSLDEDHHSIEDHTGTEPPLILHSQIADKVTQNLEAVANELNRWQERADQERALNSTMQDFAHDTLTVVREGYGRVEAALEQEIRPAVQRLEAVSTFYRSQVQRYYEDQINQLETARDTTLTKLDAQRDELLTSQAERQDEHRLLEAELHNLTEQRARLDASTTRRFDNLNTKIGELTDRIYNLPPTPHFRSDITVPALALETEDILHGLAQLRADTRIANSAVNNAMNRYARLRFDPLDELGRLRQQIASGSKWQAPEWLDNLINFRQSGQLLALAGEVSDAVAVYLESVSEFDRLNNQWCGLEVSIRDLGLTAYASQLTEAQRYLEGLGQSLTSLYSSLLMAPHSPDMARPTVFQEIYDLATGLERELEELSGMANSITRTQERLSELDAELSHVEGLLTENASEIATVTHESRVGLEELYRRLNLLLAKLEENKAARLQKIKAHIVSMAGARDTELKNLETGVEAIYELNEIADKILHKHLRRSMKLLDEANSLRHSLTEAISTIVRDFEHSSRSDRSLIKISEVFVPIWYFQLKEKVLWRNRLIGYACCYSALERLPETGDPLWKFLLTNKPATFYRLQEDTDLEDLVRIDDLEYPAGEISVQACGRDWLVSNKWVSRWLTRLFILKH